MTTTIAMAKVQFQWRRRRDIADNIRSALGLAACAASWRQIYPCTFAVAFYSGTYRDYGLALDSRTSTEWVDLADLFAALAAAVDGEP